MKNPTYKSFKTDGYFFIKWKFITLLFTLLIPVVLQVPNAYGIHSKELGWLVGRIFVVYDGKRHFKSTGFIFTYQSRHYVITAHHAVKNIQDHTYMNEIFFQLPTVEKAFPLSPVFNEPREDSVIFKIIEPLPGYIPDTIYESPLAMHKGRQLKIVGYSGDLTRKHNPRVLFANFLTLASLNFTTNNIALPPFLNEKDSTVVLAECDVPFLGMSGGPVLNEETNALIGMTKSFGISAKDRKLSKRLRVKEFHVIVRLDNTIKRIEKLR